MDDAERWRRENRGAAAHGAVRWCHATCVDRGVYPRPLDRLRDPERRAQSRERRPPRKNNKAVAVSNRFFAMHNADAR